MQLQPSSPVPGHGDAWPGPDPRNWKQTTLFDTTFVRREKEVHLAQAPGHVPAPAASTQQPVPLSPSLLGVSLSVREPARRPKHLAAGKRTRQEAE